VIAIVDFRSALGNAQSRAQTVPIEPTHFNCIFIQSNRHLYVYLDAACNHAQEQNSRLSSRFPRAKNNKPFSFFSFLFFRLSLEMTIRLLAFVFVVLLLTVPSRPSAVDDDDDALHQNNNNNNNNILSSSPLSSSPSHALPRASQHADSAHAASELPPTRLARLLRFVNQHLAFESGAISKRAVLWFQLTPLCRLENADTAGGAQHCRIVCHSESSPAPTTDIHLLRFISQLWFCL